MDLCILENGKNIEKHYKPREHGIKALHLIHLLGLKSDFLTHAEKSHF